MERLTPYHPLGSYSGDSNYVKAAIDDPPQPGSYINNKTIKPEYMARHQHSNQTRHYPHGAEPLPEHRQQFRPTTGMNTQSTPYDMIQNPMQLTDDDGRAGRNYIGSPHGNSAGGQQSLYDCGATYKPHHDQGRSAGYMISSDASRPGHGPPHVYDVGRHYPAASMHPSHGHQDPPAPFSDSSRDRPPVSTYPQNMYPVAEPGRSGNYITGSQSMHDQSAGRLFNGLTGQQSSSGSPSPPHTPSKYDNPDSFKPSLHHSALQSNPACKAPGRHGGAGLARAETQVNWNLRTQLLMVVNQLAVSS